MPPPGEQPNGLQGVKQILAVSSCKGGVGKSTVATNLAFAFCAAGKKVGLLDIDIYGPSLPTIVKLPNPELSQEDGLIQPVEHLGIKMLSFGWIPKGAGEGAAIMRGPMVSQITTQFLMGTNWGDLDLLVIDLPPGTGDIQLTLLQAASVTAALIVTTPQELSFIDVTKGIQMFTKLKVPTIGVVENMSYFVCENCDEKHYPFSRGAMRKLVEQYGFENAFEIPLHGRVTETTDQGKPIIEADPDHPVSQAFVKIAAKILETLATLEAGDTGKPNVSYAWDQGVLVEYPSGESHSIKPTDLRKACRCALCIEEFTGKALLDPDSVADDVYPTAIKPMGNYAVGITWSDGHNSSVYPYAKLKELAG